VACESGPWRSCADLSDVGLVYEAVLCHGVDSLVQCVIDLGQSSIALMPEGIELQIADRS
jgi:hypothetical protein